MIGSAIKEKVQKHNKGHDGAFLTLSDWPDQLVASTASILKVKRSEDYREHWLQNEQIETFLFK